jgi:hypothetical protein
MRRVTALVSALVGPLVIAVATTAPAHAAAVVALDRNTYVCGADPADVPGLPGFDIANSTVVVAPTGAVHVTCFGELPPGLSVPTTYVGHVICRGDPGQADSTGLIVVTVSGQVTITCLFPPPA